MAGEQNVDKQSGAPQGYIGDTRGQQFIGPNNPTAIKTFPTSVQNTIENLVHSNPEIAKDPTTAQALATHYGVNATVMANAMGYVQMQNAVKNTSQHFNIFNMGKDILGSVVDAGKFGLDVLAAPGRAVISAGKGLIRNQIQGWSGDPLANMAQTAQGGQQELQALPGMALQAVKLYQSLTTPATPEARANNWNFIKQLPLLPAHVFANLASSVHQHGANWTMSNNALNLLPALGAESFAASALEGTARTSEQVLARSVAADKELVANAESRLIDNPGDTALQAEIKAAQSRLVKHDPAWLKDTMDKTTVWNPMTKWEKDLYEQVSAKAEQAATEAATPVASNFSKSAYVSKNISEFLNKYAVGLPLKGLRGVVDATGGYGANAAYLSMMQQAQANPLTAKLWNETADLNVRDAKGHPISLGSDVATLLGQQGTLMFTPTATAINLLAQFGISDPLGRALEIPKMAKSFAGFTGKLGAWYGGLGIRGAGDITRSYRQYDSVRRAIDLIATQSSSEILKQFPGTFSKEVIGKLDKATTPQEVLSVLEDLSAGINIITSRAPTLGWYSAFKVALTGALGEKFGTLGELVGRDLIVTKELANQVKEMTGYDISVKNPFNGPTDLADKVKIAWRQRIALQFRRNPMWMRGGEMTSRKIEVGSVNSIPALMDFARTFYMPEDEIKAFGDALYAASQTSSEAFKVVYRKLVFEATMRNISSHYTQGELQSIVDALSEHAWSQVDNKIGADGGGLGGHYVSSKSDLYNMVEMLNGYFKNAGIGENHLGELILPRRSDLMRMNKAIGRMVKSINRTGLVDTFLKTNSDFNTIASVAENSGKTIEDIATHLDGSLKRTLESGLGVGEGPLPTTLAKEVENAIPQSDFYHGTSKGFENDLLNERYYSNSTSNMFGPGFYTTDSPDIARSYTGKGAKNVEKRGELNKTVYGIKWKGENPPKLIDLEQAAPKEFRDSFQSYLNEDAWHGGEVDTSLLQKFGELLKDPNATGSTIYKEFKSIIADAHMRVYDADEMLHELADIMESNGIDGLRYQGGAYAAGGKGAMHEARIFFDTNKLDIESSTPLTRTTEIITGTRQQNVAKGFEAQTKTTMSRVKQLIGGADYKELPPSERVARINAYLERKSDGLLKQYNVMKDAIERNLPLTNLDKHSVPMQDVGTMRGLARQGVTFEDWRRGAALEHLWGEHLAVQQMHFELKGLISQSFDNLDAIDAQARQIAAMSATSKESAEKFVEAFKNEWSTQTEKKIPIPIINRALGKRGVRNNAQLIQDLNQAYLDKYFKPMSLSSLGWAERVSLSEVMLNALRAGPFHFFEAFIAESFARNTIKLEKLVNDFDKVTATAAEGGGKVTLLDRQKFLIKNVVGGVMLGFDEAMIKTFATDRLERLVQDATDVILLNDGILPWGSHAQHDSVTSEAMNDAALAQVWGVDPVTNEPTASSMVRGESHVQIQNDNSAAGTALFENISRINHDRVLKPIADYAHELVTQRGAAYFSGAEGHARFLNLLEERGVQMLNSFDPRFLERFERSRLLSPADITTGDSLRDWAKAIAEHISNLGTGERGLKIHPTIFEQMSTGDIMGPRQMAKWLGDLVKKKDSPPNYFPAKEFISPLAKGSRSNLLVHASDKIHSRLLGPVVNNLSRDPLFVLEYHNEMEKLRPLIADKIYTEDQAQVLAQTNATVSMAKFIHNPLDKTMYEQNMRVLAPYYFAKNQAIRRALRMAGDNPAAYERYLKINLAVTNYISNINTGIKNGTFQIPGGEMTTAVVGSFLNWFSALEGAGASSTLAGQFGLDASPTSSAMSVITTGNQAGWLGELENFLHIPWGPVVTFPAKAIYEYATNHNPHVLSVLQKVIPESMNSSMVQDLVPNPVIKNAATGAIGYTLGDTFTNSYVSLNHYVVGDMSNQLMTQFYKELHKSDPNLFTGPIAQSSAAEAMINQKLAIKWGEYFAIPGNAQKFQDQANNRTAMLYALKTVAGFSLPVSVNIGARFLNNSKLSDIIKETNPDGTPKYSTYFLAVDEFMRRYPNNYFDLVAHTMSTGSSYPETTKTLEYLTKNPDAVRKYPNILAFAYDQGNYQSDPRTFSVERNLQLRQRETNQKYFDSLNIWTGDQMYNAKEKELLQNQHYVDRKTGGLNAKGVNQLNREMKTYGQIYNITWLADHNGGRRNQNAYVSYQQLQKAINDPSVDSAFDPGYKDFFKQAIEVRNQYEASFKSRLAAGHTTGRMKSDYYDFWQRIATQPEYAKFAPFINSVMIKLPDPQ
jgi:hypothetical protein